MADGHKSCILAAENERELELWISSLNTVIINARNASENYKKPAVSPEGAGDYMSNSTPAPFGYGTLKGLEHSKNPELARVCLCSVISVCCILIYVYHTCCIAFVINKYLF
ncbi:UNVERIFIED_CONTAM: hypothetical protein NCL1_13056 [Trichonephila clavipes]